MRSSRNRRIHAPPKVIWNLVSTIDGLPSWYSGVQSAAHIGGPKEGVGRRHTMERMLYSHDLEVEQEVVEWEPEIRMTLAHRREVVDGSQGTGVRDFRTIVTLRPTEENQTLVTIEYWWTARFGVPWLQSFLLGGRVMGREIREMLANINRIATGDD